MADTTVDTKSPAPPSSPGGGGGSTTGTKEVDLSSTVCGSCSIAFDAGTYQPHILWCGHTVCLACAFDAQSKKAQIACPYDGEITPLVSSASSVLPVNKTKLASIASGDNKSSPAAGAAAAAEAAKPAAEKCVCEKTEATLICVKCGPETLFCAECYEDNHKMAPKLKAMHKAISIAEHKAATGGGGAAGGGDDKSERCSKHDNKLTLFCQTDQTLICPQCKEEGEAHHKHETLTVAKSAADTREALNKRSADTAQSISELRTTTKSTAAAINETVASAEAAVKEVKNEIESHIAAFRAREAILIAEIQKQRTNRLTAFEARGADAATALATALGLSADVKSALANKSDLAILGSKKKSIDDAVKVLESAVGLAKGHPPTLPNIPVRFVSAERLFDEIKAFGAVGGPAAPTITECTVRARLITIRWVAEGAIVKSGTTVADFSSGTKDFKSLSGPLNLSGSAAGSGGSGGGASFLAGVGLALRATPAAVGRIAVQPIIIKEVALEMAVIDSASGKAGPFTELYRGSASFFDVKTEPLTTYHFRTRAADAISGFGEYSPVKVLSTGKAGGFVSAESKIIATPEWNKKLSDWYGVEDEWKLLYRGSRDGFTALAFHKRCDNRGETMTVVQSANGCVFGGYSAVSWASSGDYRYDKSKKSFIFSLKNNANAGQFKVGNSGALNDDKHTIYCSGAGGPTFGGGCDLAIADNFDKSSNSYADLGHSYEVPPGFRYGTPTTKCLLGGAERFKVTEIEVFGK